MSDRQFRLYHSNSVEVLTALFARHLAQPLPAQSLLSPEWVIVPQPTIKRWLQHQLAQQLGVAANLEIITPGEFVARVLKANLAGNESIDTVDPRLLVWRIFAALNDAAVIANPSLASIQHYLQGSHRQRKSWELSQSLADTFAKYQAWRRDWLLGWDRGQDPDDWQAQLWRAISAGRLHRGKAIDQFLRKYASGNAPQLAGLPPRLFVFACLNASPDVMRVIACCAHASIVHFYFPNPTRELWPEYARHTLSDNDISLLQSPAIDAQEIIETVNPLLSAWGSAGRDAAMMLLTNRIIEPIIEATGYTTPEPERDLLHRIKADMLEQKMPVPWRDSVQISDRSVQIHRCASRWQEIQVLHNQLLALLNGPDLHEDDGPLQAREIAVMAPDITLYKPYIEAVFGAATGMSHIPFSITEVSLHASNSATRVLARILAMPDDRFAVSQIFDLLTEPAVMQNFDWDLKQLDRLRELLTSAGARWGWDAQHRDGLLNDGATASTTTSAAYTWQFALDRLLLGYAAGSEDMLDNVAPIAAIDAAIFSQLDDLLSVLQKLRNAASRFAQPMSAPQWAMQLRSMMHAVIGDAMSRNESNDSLSQVLSLIARFEHDAKATGTEIPIAREVVQSWFADAMAQDDQRLPFFSNGITFCKMVPMRQIPFKVIALLGINEGEFPRNDPVFSINRLANALQQPGQSRFGDRSIRDDDRFLFLQMLNAAERVFYVSSVSRDPVTGYPKVLSSVIDDLLSTLTIYHRADGSETRQALLHDHPIQPYDLPSVPHAPRYDEYWRPACTSLRHPRDGMPVFASNSLEVPESSVIALKDLQRFVRLPPRAFVQQRLQIWPADHQADDDDEPLGKPQPLEQSISDRQLLIMLIADPILARHQAIKQLQATALLADGADGIQHVNRRWQTLQKIANSYRKHATSIVRKEKVDLTIGPFAIRGELENLHADQIFYLHYKKPQKYHLWQIGLTGLLASATDMATILWVIAEDIAQPFVLPSHSEACEKLQRLCELYREGLMLPLPITPEAAIAYAEGLEVSAEKAITEATKAWRTSNYSYTVIDDPALQLALRGALPFADDRYAGQQQKRFFELAEEFNQLLLLDGWSLKK